MPRVITTDRMTATWASPAPQIMPTLIDQKRNIRSIGSLIAVRKRTMDSAPTMPRDSTTLDCMVRMSDAVITVTPASVMLKFLE